jgi:hypothetical protein
MPRVATPSLGACVRVRMPNLRTGSLHEGVVIEVVPPGARWRSRRVIGRANRPAPVERYVVQVWERRVVRVAAEMTVVAL